MVTLAFDLIAKQSHSQHNAAILNFLVPWETCLGNQGCHISELISIATFEDCPLPWSNYTSRKATRQDLQKSGFKRESLLKIPLVDRTGTSRHQRQEDSIHSHCKVKKIYI
jgi:hypothetical protein